MRLAIAAALCAAALGLGFGADTEVITIAAYPSIVKSDQRVIVSGTVGGAKANELVTVQGKECGVPGAFFRGLWGASTTEGGSWTAEFYMRTTTVLRAVSGDELSPELTVRARAGVYLAPMPGKPGRFPVWVGGVVRLVGKRVVIERFDRGTRIWRAVSSIVLDERYGAGYKAGFRIAVPKGTTVRAHLPLSQAKPCYLAGYSRLVQT